MMKQNKLSLKKVGSVKVTVFWNMVASTLNAGMSALLLIAVTRISGIKEAGIFSLAFSIAQLMLTIGYFDMRAYQVTDVKKETPFKYYFTSRVLTCTCMMVVSIIYVWSKGYDGYKSTIVLLLCFLKMLDAFEDVLHGLFQQHGRLDIAGKLQSTRLAATMIVFIAILLATQSMMWAIVSAIITSFLMIIFLNIPIVPMFSELQLSFEPKKLKYILGACFPLFIGSYLAIYMGNAPKYAIDEFLTPEFQTYYSILFMPSFVVNLLSGFAFRPLLTPMAKSWVSGNIKSFCATLKKLGYLICGLTVLAIGGAYLFGIPVLSKLYNVPLQEHKSVLLLLIFGGGVGAVGTILYYALTVMRNQRLLLVGYVITAVAAIFLSPALVKSQGLFGAALSYVILISLRIICFYIAFLICLRKKQVKMRKEI